MLLHQMNAESPKKRARRGCPNCGGHNTENIRSVHASIYLCVTCAHRWEPCEPFCRGYRTTLKPTPRVIGCAKCGVSDAIAAWWPEAHRALAKELADVKAEALPE